LLKFLIISFIGCLTLALGTTIMLLQVNIFPSLYFILFGSLTICYSYTQYNYDDEGVYVNDKYYK